MTTQHIESLHQCDKHTNKETNQVDKSLPEMSEGRTDKIFELVFGKQVQDGK